MDDKQAFFPKKDNSTVSLAVTASNQALISGSGSTNGNQIRILNLGARTVWLEFGLPGASPVAAAATSMPMLANSVEVFSVSKHTVIAAISDGTGNTIYVTPGEGF